MKAANRLLSNLSVQAKLAVGFALVITVGLTCMASGFFGAFALSGLIAQTALAGELKSAIANLHQAQSHYSLLKDEPSFRAWNSQEIVVRKQLSLIQEKLGRHYSQQVDTLSRTWSEHEAIVQKGIAPAAMPASNSSSNPAGGVGPEQGSALELTAVESAVSGLQQRIQDNASNQLSRIYILLVVTAGLAILGSVIAVWVISRQLVTGLKHLLVHAQQIEAGDLRKVIQTSRRDEIGQLQRATQSMSSGLRELVGEISRGADQLTAASQHLSHESEEGQAQLEMQTSEVEQVSVAINQMVATVQQIARSTEQAAVTASSADQKTRDGNQVVGVVLNQIELLAEDMAELGEAMTDLQEGGKRIGQVVDVIRAVADQTNLLALNAAIEAARAGEQGRGFAVVADEVRALARRTQLSTHEIAELVLAIQKGGEKTAQVMSRSHHRTADAVRQAENARAALVEINVAVATIQAMNQQIAAAVEEQGAVAGVVNGNVSRVRDMADQSNIKASRVLASVRDLAQLGDGLKGAVRRFRL